MKLARRGLAALTCAFVVVLTGCGGGGLSEEMKTQETEMNTETGQWEASLAQWDTQHSEMRQWHASHPASGDTAALRQHEQKMSEHEQNVAQFRQELNAHQTKLREEIAKPEKDRVAAHASLWGEHMRLKAAFGTLSAAHQDLENEHASFTAGADTTGGV